MSGDESGTCLRPSIPLVLWAAGGLWMGVAVAESVAWSKYALNGVTLGDTAWMAAVALGAATVLRRRGGFAVAAGGIAVGLMLGTLFWSGYWADGQGARSAGHVTWVVEAVSDPKQGSYGQRSTVRAISPIRSAKLTCMWDRDAVAPELGGVVTVTGALQLPEEDEWGRRSHRSGVLGLIRAGAPQDHGWGTGLRGRIGPHRERLGRRFAETGGVGGALLAGVTLGDRRALQASPVMEDFRIAGLSHLVAISGSHLVIVAAVVSGLLTRTRVPRSAATAVVLVVLGLYVVATGMQASAVRAWLMAAITASSVSGGRRVDRLAALAFAVIAAIVHEPSVVFDVGFMLSVSAVMGIIVFARLAETWATQAVPAFKRLAGPLSLTIVAQVATTPVAAATFGVVSIVAPVANLVAAPLITLVLLCGLSVVVFERVLPPFAWLALKLGAAVGALCGHAASRIAETPGAMLAFEGAGAAALVCVGAAVTVWIIWPRPSKRSARAAAIIAGLLLVATVVGPPPPKGSEIVVLDVGQGDMIVVRDGREALLVDTGPEPALARDALSRAGLRRCRMVAITHLHLDHTGGIPGLSGVLSAPALAAPAGAARQDVPRFKGSGDLRWLARGDLVRVGGISVEVLSPAEPVEDASANESSIVMLVSKGAFSALLTGDAESVVLQPLIDGGLLGDVDVFKVGHHGSSDEGLPRVLEAMRPEYALISSGAGNKHGHPAASTVDALQRAGARVLRTDSGGDISVRFDERGYRVSQRHGAALAGYGTLAGALSGFDNEGSHEPQDHRSEDGLSHLRKRRAEARAGARQVEELRGSCGGSRLQHGYVRRRECGRGPDHLGCQHVALRLRAPPCRCQKHRQAQQGCT